MAHLLDFTYPFFANGSYYQIKGWLVGDSPAKYKLVAFKLDAGRGLWQERLVTNPPLETEWSHAFMENDHDILRACHRMEDHIVNSGW